MVRHDIFREESYIRNANNSYKGMYGRTAYSCYEIGCLKHGERLTRQCRKSLWVMVVFMVVSMNHKVFRVVERNSTNTCIRSFWFLVAESP